MTGSWDGVPEAPHSGIRRFIAPASRQDLRGRRVVVVLVVVVNCPGGSNADTDSPQWSKCTRLCRRRCAQYGRLQVRRLANKETEKMSRC